MVVRLGFMPGFALDLGERRLRPRVLRRPTRRSSSPDIGRSTSPDAQVYFARRRTCLLRPTRTAWSTSPDVGKSTSPDVHLARRLLRPTPRSTSPDAEVYSARRLLRPTFTSPDVRPTLNLVVWRLQYDFLYNTADHSQKGQVVWRLQSDFLYNTADHHQKS